jgi:CRISPR-associated protein (TIGR03984 family)
MPLCKPVPIDEDFRSRPAEWLAAHMSEGRPWLLAHMDDGVIWGRRDADGALRLSSEVAAITAAYPTTAATLSAATLQQVRLFGPEGELLVWRTDDGFAARETTDGEDEAPDAWNEQHLLWGRRRMEAEGFTVLEEGQQGQVHAAPLKLAEGARAALTVRHYVAQAEDGRAVVVLSRLVNVGPARPAEEVADGPATR